MYQREVNGVRQSKWGETEEFQASESREEKLFNVKFAPY
jgi:hypothetical protein